ncbi:MAG: hypothetical protein PHC66_00780 [Candidatus Nanoarchaeia archaeon]|nr:hypothetical protein [Candidatus Nanoarchaeia archaeon]MDD5239236.1 hypothetical protein [Candidatus Nanoarchaeia archaeon]
MADEEKKDTTSENSNLEITNKSPTKEEKMENESKPRLPRIHISKLKVFQFATVVLALLLVAVMLLSLRGGSISSDKDYVAEKTVAYLNENFGTTATVTSVEEKNGVYALILDIQGENTTVYVTKDGSMIFPVVIDKNANEEQTPSETQEPAAAEMAKSDTPTVELFVMTHCPYGTQMEKGILPVAELLGDKIDFEIKWVYYAMHGKTEVDEELVQYCIQTEMNDKYLDYLSCFLKDGNTTACLASTAIDTAALNKCINDTDNEFNVTSLFNDQSTWLSGRFPKMNIYLADNEKYSVGGSPTLIINGVDSGAGRDSASLLEAVCGAFTTAPAECSTNLSAAAPAPGFGYEGTGANTAATCG